MQPNGETSKNNPSITKIVIISLGIVVGIAHIGALGHLMGLVEKYANRSQYPNINLPTGPYSSWNVNVGKEGYSIEYKANDPKILESERSLNIDRERKGFFGGGSERRNEYRKDQYTMGGVRNLGGADLNGEGKASVESEECIRADAGARSQGAMAGASIATGAIAPALTGIPYIGWLAAGWAVLLGQEVGSDIGSEVGSTFNDC